MLIHLGLSHKLCAAENPHISIQSGEVKAMDFSNTEAFEELSVSDIPEVENPPEIKKPFYFSYKESLGAFVGPIYDLDEEETDFAFGLVYDKYQKDFSSYHFALSIIDSDGRLDFGKKYIHSFTKKLRYHYGYFAGLTFDSDKGLANFVNFKKILVGGILGIERSFTNLSLRNDLKLLAGVDEAYLQVSLYFIYSW